MIITTYRVRKWTGKAGSTATWFQQKVLFEKDYKLTDPHDDALVKDTTMWIIDVHDPTMELVMLVLGAKEQWSAHLQI